jgi:hypothetical protein
VGRVCGGPEGRDGTDGSAASRALGSTSPVSAFARKEAQALSNLTAYISNSADPPPQGAQALVLQVLTKLPPLTRLTNPEGALGRGRK